MTTKKLLTILIIATLVLIAPGCRFSNRRTQNDNTNQPPIPETDHLSPGTYNQEIKVNEQTRTYRLYIPEIYSEENPVPLLIVLHGGYGNGIQMEETTGFDNIADKEGFVVAYPNGLKRGVKTITVLGKTVQKDDVHWADGRGPGITGSEQDTKDDVAFISSLIDEVSKKTSIDSKKVYITGFSNGGIMTQLLGIELSDKLAAIAPVSGTIAQNISGKRPSSPISVIEFHGTKDPLISYNGGAVAITGGDVLSVDQTIEYWIEFDKTTKELSVEKSGESVEHYSYIDGTNKTEVHLYKIIGGGHTWPDSQNKAQIDGAQIIWDFLKTKSRY